MSSTIRSLLCLAGAVIVLPLVAAVVAQQPARDGATTVINGTGIIAGTLVTDDRTPRPIRRALISISTGTSGSQRLAVTDDAGRFAFTRLPAGNYASLRATKPGYVTTTYGEKRVGGIGTPITLADGQRVSVTMKMLRGAVITGTVLDQRGRPSASTQVSATAVKIVNGERSAVSGIYNQGATTDDRGIFRIFGLAPGDYIVSASARFSSSGELRPITAEELRWAQAQLNPSTAGIGATVSPVPPKPAAAIAYTPVYFPGTTDIASATLVTVTAGQERSGVDFSTQLVTTARIDGTVVDPEGRAPATAQMNLVPKIDTTALAMNDFFFIDSMILNRPTVVNGKFSIAGVRPGSYTLSVRAAPAGAGPARGDLGRGAAAASPMTLWAMQDIDVNGEDQTGLQLRLEPGMTITGRIAFDGTTLQPPADLSRASVRLASAPTTSGITVSVSSSSGGPVAADGTFKIEGVTPGRYLLTASAPAAAPVAGVSWLVRSAMVNGVDAADVPFEVRPSQDISNAIVTFTDRGAEVSGTILDANGKPTPDFSIILFPVDRAMWSQRSRRIRTPVRASTEGKFKFANVVAGEYYLAALTDFEPGDIYKPDFLDQVVPAAIKVTLAEGEKKEQNLKLAGGTWAGPLRPGK